MSNSKTADWNKWMLIYNGTESGTEYLTQKDYEFFVEAVRDKDAQIVLKDGRILPTWGARVRQNPDWIDPEEIAHLKKQIEAQEKLRERRHKDLLDI